MAIPASAIAYAKVLELVANSTQGYTPSNSTLFIQIVNPGVIPHMVAAHKVRWNLVRIPVNSENLPMPSNMKERLVYVVRDIELQPSRRTVFWLIVIGKQIPDVVLKSISFQLGDLAHCLTPDMRDLPCSCSYQVAALYSSMSSGLVGVLCTKEELCWLATCSQVPNRILTLSCLVSLFPWVAYVAQKVDVLMTFNMATTVGIVPYIRGANPPKFLGVHWIKSVLAVGLFGMAFSNQFRTETGIMDAIGYTVKRMGAPLKVKYAEMNDLKFRFTGPRDYHEASWDFLLRSFETDKVRVDTSIDILRWQKHETSRLSLPTIDPTNMWSVSPEGFSLVEQLRKCYSRHARIEEQRHKWRLQAENQGSSPPQKISKLDSPDPCSDATP